MASQQQLTNEQFADVYDNKFDLALHIIGVAQSRMNAGEDVSLTKLLNEFRKEAEHHKVDHHNVV